MGMGHVELASGLAIAVIVVIFVFKELLHMNSSGVKRVDTPSN
jgi:hypothetical protein